MFHENFGAVDVSIIMPCRNERDFIEASVMSVLNQLAPAGGFELIVADGMSNDGTRDILESISRRDPRLRVIENAERIVSTGLNRAIQHARGTVIIRMDAHTEYAPDYVRQCLEVLEKTRAACVGGPWVAKGRGLVGRCIAATFRSRFAVGGARGHNPNYEGVVDTVYLGCWRRETFERIGLFDPELVRNQDDEFSLRLTRSGGKIWQSPAIKSWYTPRSSLKSLCRQYSQYGYWKVRVIQKHKLPASIRHLIPGLFVFSIVTLGIGSFLWPLAFGLWLTLLSAYGIVSLWASLAIAYREGVGLLPLLPLVFGCYHFGYGWGFLRGVVDFGIFGKQRSARYTLLTRTSDSGRAERFHK